MKQSAPYAIIGLGVIVMAGIAWWFGFRQEEEPVSGAPATPDIVLSEGLAIYASGEQGFLVAYPEGAVLSETFNQARLPNRWSVSGESEGTPLLEIVTYRITQESAYPRDYAVLVRIGKSKDEAGSCTEAKMGEVPRAKRMIGEEAWSAFAYGDAAMMQYVEALSYRTVHTGECWAIETVRTGSNYREEASPQDLSNEALQAEFARLESIVESFRFAR